LYLELYKRSYKASDKKEALDIFERVIKRFSRSSYKLMAEAEIKALIRTRVKKKAATPKTASERKLLKAEACYKKLRGSTRKMKYRENWLRCIDKFEAVYKKDPTGPWAAAGLFKSGELYRELYKRSYKASDKKEALDIFKRVIRQFSGSEYRALAEETLGIATQKKTKTTAQKSVSATEKLAAVDDIAEVIEKSSPQISTIPKTVDDSEVQKTTVTNLRFWSNPSYTRIVIDADSETIYTHRLLKKDPAIQKPQRLFVDLDKSKLGKDTTKKIPINDNLLSDVRAGQYTLDAVRVVVDIKSFERYNIFSLKNPFRVVIDVWGSPLKAVKERIPPVKTAKKDKKMPASALAKQLALGVRRIVIDPGHGGRDYGAPGYFKGVHEKQVALAIAKRLARKIKERLGLEVIMTRKSDRHLTLEERTAIANTKNADLFISIHTNSIRDRRVYGIETYFLNLATDNDAILVAARENATSTKNISDLQTILNDLMHNAKVNESSRLATYVQESLYRHMNKQYSRIKNKGVKQAPFYVLLGAQMPSILIETSFISNSRECKRLTNRKYQDQLSEAIIKGIRRYIKETHPTAFVAPPQPRDSKG
ncbi:N-acetylmuramoyl-L-alanine amidase, partial [Thermodesulfobacteriota bacterium]